MSSLAMDASGNLYGTTSVGGPYGLGAGGGGENKSNSEDAVGGSGGGGGAR